jgi:hypothetical protein
VESVFAMPQSRRGGEGSTGLELTTDIDIIYSEWECGWLFVEMYSNNGSIAFSVLVRVYRYTVAVTLGSSVDTRGSGGGSTLPCMVNLGYTFLKRRLILRRNGIAYRGLIVPFLLE